MTTEAKPHRKAGRAPLNGESPLTKAEIQKRWRSKQKANSADSTADLSHLKRQISINIDEATLTRLDACADTQLKCSRSEAIRILLNARMNQIDALFPQLQRIEAEYAKADVFPFSAVLHELKLRNRAMLKEGATTRDYLEWMQENHRRLAEIVDESV